MVLTQETVYVKKDGISNKTSRVKISRNSLFSYLCEWS